MEETTVPAPARSTDESQALLGGGSGALQPSYDAVPSAADASASGAGAQAETASQGSGRRRSGEMNPEHAQFQAATREAVRSNMTAQRTWRSPLTAFVLVFLAFTLLVVPSVIIVYVEFRSWMTLLEYGREPCDEDLAVWLLVRNCLTLFAPRMPGPGEDEEAAQRRREDVETWSLFALLWLLIGYYQTLKSVTCHETNPHLFEWVRFLTLFGLLIHVLTVFFPLMAIFMSMAYQSLIDRGWLKSPNAALDDTITKMRPVNFADESAGESRMPSTCCCCMEEFGPDRSILCTPCEHYYHYDCLEKWLKLANTCPMCRTCLDAAPDSNV